MHCIRPWLFIGARRDSRNPGLLAAAGITAILQLAKPVEHPGIVSRFLPVDDAEPLSAFSLREGVDFILDEMTRGSIVLAACSGGFSRSVAFAVAALKEAEGLKLSEALEEIRRQHPDASPHTLIWESLCEYYREGHPSRRLPRKRGRWRRSR